MSCWMREPTCQHLALIPSAVACPGPAGTAAPTACAPALVRQRTGPAGASALLAQPRPQLHRGEALPSAISPCSGRLPRRCRASAPALAGVPGGGVEEYALARQLSHPPYRTCPLVSSGQALDDRPPDRAGATSGCRRPHRGRLLLQQDPAARSRQYFEVAPRGGHRAPILNSWIVFSRAGCPPTFSRSPTRSVRWSPRSRLRGKKPRGVSRPPD